MTDDTNSKILSDYSMGINKGIEMSMSTITDMIQDRVSSLYNRSQLKSFRNNPGPQIIQFKKELLAELKKQKR